MKGIVGIALWAGYGSFLAIGEAGAQRTDGRGRKTERILQKVTEVTKGESGGGPADDKWQIAKEVRWFA